MNGIGLFLLFAKFGILAIGGGYVVIPLLYETFVDNLATINQFEFGNLVSVSQLTPGPTSINFATYIGYLISNIKGAMLCTFGFIFPSLILTSIACLMISKYNKTLLVQGFLKGGRLAAFVMVFYSSFLFLKMSVINCTIPLKLIISSLFKGSYHTGSVSFNILEIIVLIGSFYLIKRGFSITKTIILSALLGFGLSYIKYIN